MPFRPGADGFTTRPPRRYPDTHGHKVFIYLTLASLPRLVRWSGSYDGWRCRDLISSSRVCWRLLVDMYLDLFHACHSKNNNIRSETNYSGNVNKNVIKLHAWGWSAVQCMLFNNYYFIILGVGGIGRGGHSNTCILITIVLNIKRR